MNQLKNIPHKQESLYRVSYADLFEIIKNEKIKKEDTLTPTIRSLKGILKGKQLDEKDYKKYLEEKYL